MEVNESGAYFLDPQQTCLAYLPAEAIANQEELSQLKEVCREKELQWVDEYKAVWEFCFPYQLNAGDGAKFLLCWVKDRLLGNGVKQYIWAVFILCLWMWGFARSGNPESGNCLAVVRSPCDGAGFSGWRLDVSSDYDKPQAPVWIS